MHVDKKKIMKKVPVVASNTSLPSILTLSLLKFLYLSSVLPLTFAFEYSGVPKQIQMRAIDADYRAQHARGACHQSAFSVRSSPSPATRETDQCG